MNTDIVNIRTLSLGAEEQRTRGARGTQSSRVDDVLDRDAFLQLLVTQLQYQNPLDPTSNEEFIAQSAAFSSLEEMQNLNANMQALIELEESSSITAALNLIGRNVTVNMGGLEDRPCFRLSNGATDSLNYLLSADGSVTIAIYDASGKLVRTVDIGSQTAGDHSFAWDGLSDVGTQMPDRSYSYEVSAIDADGNDVNASETVSGVVDGIIASENEPHIRLGDLRIPVSAVTEVWD
jgi:flagellar basal-body rod modification protein FlgD